MPEDPSIEDLSVLHINAQIILKVYIISDLSYKNFSSNISFSSSFNI